MTPTDKIHNLICFNSDCIEVMDNMKPESVGLIVTDPPYLIDYQTNHRSTKNAKAGSREALLQKKIENDEGSDGKSFIRRYIQRCFRILKPDTAMYMFCGADSDDEDLLHFFKAEVRKTGFKIANVIIWKKDNWSAGDLEGAFGRQYENIIFAHKGRPKLRGHRYSDIWEFDRVPDKDRIHPNQKPLALLARAIESSSDQGDFLFDGCAGSGSLGLACHTLNRRAILCEKDSERYSEMKSYLQGRITEDLFTGI